MPRTERPQIKTLPDRIREWDEAAEDDEDFERIKPFDAGAMLAIAETLDAYGSLIRGEKNGRQRLASAMSALRETAEAVLGDDEEEDDDATD